MQSFDRCTRRSKALVCFQIFVQDHQFAVAFNDTRLNHDDFLPPSSGVFRLSHLGVIAGYPMQTVMRFSRSSARFGNKKSPHNNLNLTIPSGMALVRVRYVAIRKSKTCSGSFRSRAGTLGKYVILNCWDRLPQKSIRVNKKF